MSAKMSSERLPSVNPRFATNLEDFLSKDRSTLVVKTGVEGGTELRRDRVSGVKIQEIIILPERDYQRQQQKR